MKTAFPIAPISLVKKLKNKRIEEVIRVEIKIVLLFILFVGLSF